MTTIYHMVAELVKRLSNVSTRRPQSGEFVQCEHFGWEDASLDTFFDRILIRLNFREKPDPVCSGVARAAPWGKKYSCTPLQENLQSLN